jgi:hypothetical protein
MWDLTFERNKELAQSTTAELDVVLLGDSITEHWLGTDLALTDHMRWQGVSDTFRAALFDKSFGAKIDGLPLGIGGDLVSQFSPVQANNVSKEEHIHLLYYFISYKRAPFHALFFDVLRIT